MDAYNMCGVSGRRKAQRVQSFKDPGEESKRKYREEFTKLDKLHMALTELSYALNYSSVIHVWGHGFVPREFFIHNLEGRFNKALPGAHIFICHYNNCFNLIMNFL